MAKFRWTRGWIAAVAVLALGLVLLGVALAQRAQPRQTDLTTALADIRADIARGHVDTISIDGSTLTLDRGNGQVLQTGIGQSFSLSDTLQRAGVPLDNPAVLRVNYAQPSAWSAAGGPLFSLALIALLVGGLWFLSRRGQSGGAALSFARSRAKLFTQDKPSVTFTDVAGVDEARQELQEIVEFLKYPRKFAQLGARVPKGVLLAGPPGTGKTLVSRAVAGEAGVPFFSISGSEFVEMFVGVGASRMRDLFEQAKKAAPSIIFVDEIDAVGRQRGSGFGGSHDEREQTLNQMLVEMDGFDPNTNVIVMAATNRADVLDAALLRPGRFDRQITLDRPDARGRAAILRVHARNKPVAAGVDLDLIARQTAGFSGADLQNLLNEAAILTARAGGHEIGMAALEEAMDRVLAGPVKTRVIGEREKAITAYHEVGHALVAHLLPHCDPVHKVSIIARGQMGGYTRLVAEEERSLWSKSQFRDFLAFALGGHAAEKLVFGEVTTGASNDIERVTAIARKMVTDYGMSERLGPVRLSHRESAPGERPEYSEETARAIDAEVREIVSHAMRTAERLLAEHRERLVLMSERLIEREVLEGREFVDLFDAPIPDGQTLEPHAALSTTTAGHGIPPTMGMNLASGQPPTRWDGGHDGGATAIALPG